MDYREAYEFWLKDDYFDEKTREELRSIQIRDLGDCALHLGELLLQRLIFSDKGVHLFDHFARFAVLLPDLLLRGGHRALILGVLARGFAL